MLKNSELKSLAGAGAYARGKDYYAQGRVRLTRVGKIAIEGEAYGTETYALWLKREGAEWRYACACPVGAEGSFCKHLVAAGLAWQSGEREPQPVNVHDELLEYLRAQPAERLAGWLKEFADEDREVEKRLRLYRAAEDPAELKKALGKMLNAGGFLDYRGSLAYARRLDAAIAQIEKLLARDAGACLSLCEYALGRLFKIYERSDDSAGAIGERMAAWADLHARAFRKAKPEGRLFARTLYSLRGLDQWGLLPLDRYWSAMDSLAQDEYRRLVVEALDHLPAEPRGNDRYGKVFFVRSTAEELARISRDFDLLQRVLRWNLTESRDHLKVAESLLEFGREREALQWLENAVKLFPEDTRLRDALALCLEKSGLNEEAQAQRWSTFCLHPDERSWAVLKAGAGADWPQWRARALAELDRYEREGEADLRVRLLLHEGEIESAARLAEIHAVPSGALAELARRMEESAPLKAGMFYLRCARAQEQEVESGSYDRFVDYTQQAARLLPDDAWRPWLNDVKDTYRRKRKLLDMLDARGL